MALQEEVIDAECVGAQVGTPICVPSQGGVDLGKIASLELNHKPVDRAKKGESVAMKIEATNTTEATRLYGRHFDHKVPRSLFLQAPGHFLLPNNHVHVHVRELPAAFMVPFAKMFACGMPSLHASIYDLFLPVRSRYAMPACSKGCSHMTGKNLTEKRLLQGYELGW